MPDRDPPPDSASPDQTARPEPGAHDPGRHDPGRHDPGAHDPGLHDPGAHAPGPHAPGDGPLGKLLGRQAAGLAERPFVIEPDTGRTLTFGGAGRFRDRLSDLLASLGAAPGDRVALVCPNSAAAAAASLAVMASGRVLVPAGPASSPPESRRLVGHSGAALVLAAPDLASRLAGDLPARVVGEIRLEESSTGAPDLAVLRPAPIPPNDAPSMEAAPADAAPVEAPPVEAPPKDLALILYTSGTTGPPKGVMLTGANLAAGSGFVAEAHRLAESDRALCLLPLHHVNGLVVTLLAPLAAGCAVLMPPRFSLGRFWEWVAAGRATWFSAVPTILSLLLGRDFPPSESITALRFARSASAPLPRAVREEFERRLGRPVIESYGISEAASQVTSNPLPPADRPPGSVGLPFGCRIRIGGPPGGEGEVLVSGPNVSPGYWRDPAATAAAFGGGWLRTGDLGRIGPGGHLWLTGRLKELINRAGEMISPREVDEVLHLRPEIGSAAAVGVPHPLYGEEVVAFATARPGRTLEEGPILEFCRTLLSPHKAPKRLYQVDELPKGPSGKIQRLKLAGRYRALAAEGDGLPGPDRSGAAAAGPSDSAGRSGAAAAGPSDSAGRSGAAPAAPADPAARSGADPAGPTDAADPPGPAGPADSAVPGGEAVGRAGGRFSVAIDFQACKGCRYCLALCPASVFDEGSARNARGHAPPLAARPGDCLGCRACFMACPDFCLEIEEI